MRQDEVEYENLSDVANDDDDDPTIVIPFQNENLCAYMELQDGTRTVNIYIIFQTLFFFFFDCAAFFLLGDGKCSGFDYYS